MQRTLWRLGMAIMLMGVLAGPALAAEPARITDDTTVLRYEGQIIQAEGMTATEAMVMVGDKERIGTIIFAAPGIEYRLVMRFIYQPYETADGKWAYPCIGVERYLEAQ